MSQIRRILESDQEVIMRHTRPRAPREWLEFGPSRLAAVRNEAVETLIATPLGIVPSRPSIRLRRGKSKAHRGGSHE